MHSVAMEPKTTRTHRPHDGCRRARLELTELVAGAEEHRVHGTDPPTQGIWRFGLHQGVPHYYADHVGRAGHGQGQHQKLHKLSPNANTPMATA